MRFYLTLTTLLCLCAFTVIYAESNWFSALFVVNLTARKNDNAKKYNYFSTLDKNGVIIAKHSVFSCQPRGVCEKITRDLIKGKAQKITYAFIDEKGKFFKIKIQGNKERNIYTLTSYIFEQSCAVQKSKCFMFTQKISFDEMLASAGKRTYFTAGLKLVEWVSGKYWLEPFSAVGNSGHMLPP